jgi:PAS domain S-box-containing protein
LTKSRESDTCLKTAPSGEAGVETDALGWLERRYKFMIDHMGEGLGITDREERFLFCNPSAERLFGVRPGELVGRNIRDFLSAEEYIRIRNEADRRTKDRRSSYETEILAMDGSRKTLSIIALPWLSADGSVSGSFATFRDVTAQRRAEAAVGHERDMAQRYLDIAGVLMVAIDASHKVTMINHKGCEVLGLSEVEIVGRDWFETFIPARLRKRVSHVFDQLMAEEIAPVEYFENPVLTADKDERLVAWHNTMLYDENGKITGTLSSGEDITDRKLTEKKLLRLERMRAMAEMTAGISHNLNNILVSVTAHCQFLQKATRDNVLLKEAKAIMKSARRAENLVQRLGWAVLGRDEEIQPVSLKGHVLEAVKEVRHYCRSDSTRSRRNVEILSTLDEVPNVRGTSAGMHDVLINVLLNAVDAMPEGGTIRLSTKETPDAVQLTVRDNGAGMDEETRSKVFEPFFTTKAQVGTGLGLSTVYGAVTRWGGAVDVWSSPGRGTTVTLFFKKCSAAVNRCSHQPKNTDAMS